MVVDELSERRIDSQDRKYVDDFIDTLYDAVEWLAEAGHIPKERALRWTHPGRGRD